MAASHDISRRRRRLSTAPSLGHRLSHMQIRATNLWTDRKSGTNPPGSQAIGSTSRVPRVATFVYVTYANIVLSARIAQFRFNRKDLCTFWPRCLAEAWQTFIPRK